ncbi:hypothetical protein DERF_011800 [Dermatophagoides farinae]|uniref:Uncharacterized protein n=1 Tax=Dermatophagoides farinae TaxID=6954 RepID=A0A922L0V5_DERFA|nr:hypothetical protein DERF_011800 [Dermatophagoides farinae]
MKKILCRQICNNQHHKRFQKKRSTVDSVESIFKQLEYIKQLSEEILEILEKDYSLVKQKYPKEEDPFKAESQRKINEMTSSESRK